MDVFYSALLGVVQGMTEFLPVSSSGHLVLVKHLIPNLKTPGVLFEVILHAGTTLAIIFYFGKRLIPLIRKYLRFIVIGSIPAAVVGLLLQDPLEKLFSNVMVVGVFLVVTGGINYMTDKIKVTKKNISISKSIWIGIAQSIAIIPGISRSGSTIFAGTKLGLSKKEAAEFSFLLSIPVILGANVLQIAKHGFDSSLSIFSYGVGFVAAGVSGYFAIGLLVKVLEGSKFVNFAYYCVAIGSVILIFLS